MSDATYRTGTASRPLETDETHRLISSAKVHGTECYNRNGDHLGTVDHMMIDKYHRAGRVRRDVVRRVSRHRRELSSAAVAFADLRHTGWAAM